MGNDHPRDVFAMPETLSGAITLWRNDKLSARDLLHYVFKSEEGQMYLVPGKTIDDAKTALVAVSSKLENKDGELVAAALDFVCGNFFASGGGEALKDFLFSKDGHDRESCGTRESIARRFHVPGGDVGAIADKWLRKLVTNKPETATAVLVETAKLDPVKFSDVDGKVASTAFIMYWNGSDTAVIPGTTKPSGDTQQSSQIYGDTYVPIIGSSMPKEFNETFSKLRIVHIAPQCDKTTFLANLENFLGLLSEDAALEIRVDLKMLEKDREFERDACSLLERKAPKKCKCFVDTWP
ncbi:MAG: hypothetical protein LBI39_03090 [Puniceicoccales bacterium]|nr:hypothetical protein [Puniceicoccales bacterium]